VIVNKFNQRKERKKERWSVVVYLLEKAQKIHHTTKVLGLSLFSCFQMSIIPQEDLFSSS
jgi:hypothetical protein